ncbi:MAG: transporter [Bacteroidetes bacterium]|nr:MAG: transporter [Bacteroidota bacterium]REK03530.1 MAG: transporter [Bacteroidota bacterium]REK34833.1 MAG: transporter [Bacteroidota bacterium]REK51204.1 MAG: transporter [Bacteroidota bacterium]
MISKNALCLLIYCFIGNLTFAQYSEVIRTGRPGQAITPFTPGKNVYQIQTGIETGKSGFREENTKKLTYFSSNLFLRAGLTERLEINSTFDYRTENDRRIPSDSKESGLSRVNAGMRYLLKNMENQFPAIAVQYTVQLNTFRTASSEGDISNTLLFGSSQNLGKNTSLSLNAGIDYNFKSDNVQGLYVINLGYSFTSKISGFAEVYGNWNGASIKTYFNTGIGILVNENFLLDIFGGYGSNQGEKFFFGSAGLSYRFTHFRKL